MCNAFRNVTALGVAVLLAACQPLPQPFQPAQSKKEDNPLLQLPDRAGVLVRPVSGLPAETARELSNAVAIALVKRNIPAFTDTGNRESLVLGGLTERANEKPQIVWRLFGMIPGDAKTERFVTDTPPQVTPPDRAAVLRPLAERVADAIAARIQNPVIRDRTATLKKRYLHVASVTGPPKDAAAVLKNELETALRLQALRVSGTLRDNSLVIAGNVFLSDGDAGKKRLTVSWVVSRKDGRELGKLSQANEVAPTELDRNWPAIAQGIAVSAAQGVRRLLDRIPETAIDRPADGT